MSLPTRLAVYAPAGARTGILAAPPAWQASFPWNDISALSLDYAKAATDATLLDGAFEIGIEIHDGTNWVEPANGRFLALEQAGDSAKGDADIIKYSLPGFATLLDGVKVLPAAYGTKGAYDSDGKRKFLSATVGDILTVVLSEARMLVPQLVTDLTLGFTSTLDSTNTAWTKRVTIYYEPGISLWTALDNLAQQGQCDWWMQGRTLMVVNPDSTGAEHPSVQLMTASEAPSRTSRAGLLHTAILVGDGGETWLVNNPSTPTPWGKSMTVINQGGVRDEGTALSLIDQELTIGSQERTEYTLASPVDLLDSIPLLDFIPGDTVSALNASGVLELMRVHQVTLNHDGKSLSAGITLNDRFVDSQVRAAKRTKGIVNGASGDAGSGTLPTPSNPVAATPVPPSGLVVLPTAYLDSRGDQHGLLTVSWTAVTASTDGDLIGVGSYIVGWRENTADKAWSPVNTSALSVGVSPVPVGVELTVAVKAVGENGRESDWSAAWVGGVPVDSTPPPAPSLPVLAQRLGVVTISWDGKNSSNAGMPADFDRCDVERENKGLIGSLLRAGDFLTVPDQTPGVPQRYRLIAVDRVGNRSVASSWASITTSKLIASDLDPSISDSLDSALADASAALSAAGIAQSTADGAVGAAGLAQASAAAAQTAADQAKADATSKAAAAEAAAKTFASSQAAAAEAAAKAAAALDAKTKADAAQAAAEAKAATAQTTANTAKTTADLAAKDATLSYWKARAEKGRVLAEDVAFRDGTNSVAWYVAASGATTAVGAMVRVSAPPGCPTTSTHILQSTTTTLGADNGRRIGVLFPVGAASRAGMILIQTFVAKAPAGTMFLAATNQLGSPPLAENMTAGGGYHPGTWLTTNVAHGGWQEYVRLIVCGTTGVFGTTGHIYGEAPVGTVAPVVIEIASHTLTDVTDTPRALPGQLLDGINNANTAIQRKLTRSHLRPTITAGYPVDAIWWVYPDATLTGGVIEVWALNGGVWEPAPLDSQAIANLSVDKLTAYGQSTFSEILVQKLVAHQAFLDAVIARKIVVAGDPTNKVSNVMIESGAVTADKMAANSVTANAIEAGAISAQHLAARAVTADKIDLKAVDRTKLADTVQGSLNNADAWAAVTAIEPGRITLKSTTGSGSTSAQMVLTPTRLSMEAGGSEVAYIDSAEQTLAITRARITNSIQVGRHIIESYDSELTLFRWVG